MFGRGWATQQESQSPTLRSPNGGLELENNLFQKKETHNPGLGMKIEGLAYAHVKTIWITGTWLQLFTKKAVAKNFHLLQSHFNEKKLLNVFYWWNLANKL